ncbi:MAG: PAS domain-containing protein [Phycisphaerae bacterium]|nr:PAS domain-containing protein [Phycisphaerae bacterium]
MPIWTGKTLDRALPRGESLIASTGLAVALVLIACLGGAGGWMIVQHREAARADLVSDLESQARVVARSAEGFLRLENPTGLRQLLVEAAATHGLVRCRVVRADGVIVADGIVPRVAVRRSGEARVSEGEASPEGAIALESAMSMPDGSAGRLEVARRAEYPAWARWESLTGVCVAGVVGMGATWGLYRRLRRQVRGMSAIREALLAMDRGEGSSAALTVAPTFGREAARWNALLEERSRLRMQAREERPREATGAREEGPSELAQACEALWLGLVVIDPELTCRYANSAAGVFLGVRREELIGSRLGQHVRDAAFLTALEALRTGTLKRRATVEWQRPSPEGKESSGPTVLRLTIRPVRRDDAHAAIVVVEDVTQQRVADAARNAFVAQATHELRTPLTNIRLYVEQAIEAGEGETAVRANALNVINQESRRLERLVGDMLSVSEIEAGAMKLHADDVRLDALFEELQGDYRQQAEEKGLGLRFVMPPKVPVIRGDRDKLAMALHNLIGNALKYTPRGGSVEVRVVEESGELRVEVSDTGIGIKPEESELVFERFYRAQDERVRQITGTGLGLALAREVARLHGGDVTLRSQLNQGSTFTLTVPAMSEAA